MLAGLKRVMSLASQTAALLAVLIAAVSPGVIDPNYQLIVLWLLLAALVMTFRWPVQSIGNQRWIVPVFLAWFLWLGLVILQFTELPRSVIARLAPFSNLIRAKFVSEGVAVPSTLSLVPWAGRTEWPLYAMGCGFFVLGAIAFNQRALRLRLWWFVAVVGMAMPILSSGLTRFAAGNDLAEQPIASGIIQGNPLAAMLLLSLACLIGCCFEWMRPTIREQIKRVARMNQIPVRSGRPKVREGLEELDRRTIWHQPMAYVFLGLAEYLCIAIAWIASTTFCLAMLATLVFWAIVVRRLIPPRSHVATGILLMMFVAASAVHLDAMMSATDAAIAGHGTPSLAISQLAFHWSDAIDTTFDSPRVGTGLGTYPYVHLLHLDFDSSGWYRDPHSMLLKWSVETGLLGIVILFAGTTMFVMLIRRLFYRRLNSTIFLPGFSIGMIAGLMLLILSVLDSVLLTPVVFWSYALVLGSVATTVTELKVSKIRSIDTADTEKLIADREAVSLAQTPFVRRLAGHPHPWTALTCAVLLYGQTLLREQIDDAGVLTGIAMPAADSPPAESESTASRAALKQRIDRGTWNPRMYELLGYWELVEYRRALIAHAGDQGQPLQWKQTAPESFYYLYQRMSGEQQAATVALCRGSESLLKQLDRAMYQFELSLARNPLQPRLHVLDALYSPITQRDERRAIINAKRLAAADADVRFEVGKIGWSINDQTLMSEQWRRLIAKPSDHTFSVLRMARAKIAPETLVDQIIADAGPDRWKEIRTLVDEHEVLKPLRPLIRRSQPATDDG